MPTQYGSANLAPLTITSVGVRGLNLQAQSSLLDSTWATDATNCVFDTEGRLASRNGWTQVNSTPITSSPNIAQLFEYVPISGNNQIITSTDTNKLYSGTTTFTDITGSLTITSDNWKFVNFNGNVYGLQTGHPLIVYSGSASFTSVAAASGSVPNGNELLSAFGRLWGSDSTGQILSYSQLLDATNWNVTGAGSFNLTSVWGNGNDSIVALASFNNYLVVFGSNNIIVWGDGSGSVLGMNPINMQVIDMIPGIGCIARDSVQNCNGDDLVFLTASGVQSLKRIILERSNAIKNLSMNVRDALNTAVRLEGVGVTQNIRSTYNAANGFYLLLLPTSNTIFAFDTKITLDDGSWRVTTWNSFLPQTLLTLHDSFTLYGGGNGVHAGHIYSYGGSVDAGSSFTVSYSSPWLALEEELRDRLKMLKRASSIIAYSGTGTLTTQWSFDFSTSPTSYQITMPTAGSVTTVEIVTPTSGTGQFIKLGLSYLGSSQITFLQMQMYTKLGRLA